MKRIQNNIILLAGLKLVLSLLLSPSLLTEIFKSLIRRNVLIVFPFSLPFAIASLAQHRVNPFQITYAFKGARLF